jgi:hypothetical protein
LLVYCSQSVYRSLVPKTLSPVSIRHPKAECTRLLPFTSDCFSDTGARAWASSVRRNSGHLSYISAQPCRGRWVRGLAFQRLLRLTHPHSPPDPRLGVSVVVESHAIHLSTRRSGRVPARGTRTSDGSVGSMSQSAQDQWATKRRLARVERGRGLLSSSLAKNPPRSIPRLSSQEKDRARTQKSLERSRSTGNEGHRGCD